MYMKSASGITDCYLRRKADNDAVFLSEHTEYPFCFNKLIIPVRTGNKEFPSVISRSPVPVIAAVNAKAFGGGLEMILAADFAYGVDNVKLWFPEVMIGILPGVGGTTTLPRIVGEHRANEIILAGGAFGSAEALEWGIFNRVCSIKELMPAAIATAVTIAGNAPLAVRQAKKAIHEGLQMDVRTALRYEVECYNRLTGTEDRAEGTLAWNEKRKPVFKGR